MGWPQYFDGNVWENKWSSRFRIHSIPTVWVVRKDGRIAAIDARGRVEDLLKQLLAE